MLRHNGTAVSGCNAGEGQVQLRVEEWKLRVVSRVRVRPTSPRTGERPFADDQGQAPVGNVARDLRGLGIVRVVDPRLGRRSVQRSDVEEIPVRTRRCVRICVRMLTRLPRSTTWIKQDAGLVTRQLLRNNDNQRQLVVMPTTRMIHTFNLQSTETTETRHPGAAGTYGTMVFCNDGED